MYFLRPNFFLKSLKFETKRRLIVCIYALRKKNTLGTNDENNRRRRKGMLILR